jgi:transposase InsO family protein
MMKTMLEWQDITRQGAHQSIEALRQKQRDVRDTVELAADVREDHPQMGCRDMYWAKRGKMPRGRDWTEQVLLNCGYRVKKKPRSFTQAGEDICPNLIEGRNITHINQVWQTDITYVWTGRRWYYVSFVIDVFNRQIIARHCSRDLSSMSQVRCLKKAVKSQKGSDLSTLIVHTDRGVQYTSNHYKKYLKDHEIRHSMAHFAWQNAYCERVNRTIKENYLNYYSIEDYDTLCSGVGKAVRLYNCSKPHSNLPSRLSPAEFTEAFKRGEYSDYHVKVWSKLTSIKMLNVN